MMSLISRQKGRSLVFNPVLAMALLLFGSSQTGCSDPVLVPDGYWRFESPVKARIIKKTIIKKDGDRALVLTYFAGPMLNSGVNTEKTTKEVVGHIHCGYFLSSEDVLILQIDMRYELGGPGEGEVAVEMYPVGFADGSLIIEGLMNFPGVPYVNTEELTNEEALAFQRFSEACKSQ